MRKVLIQIHSYLGLFCLPYLLIFGISSLDFNHEMKFLEGEFGIEEQWEEKIVWIDSLDERAMAEAINDSLNIMGWYYPWSSHRDSVEFRYDMGHFGQNYSLNVSIPEQKVIIEAKTNTVSNIIKGLHFLGEDIPNAPWWINAWQYYQDLSVYSLLFWVITGIILWSQKKTDWKWGMIIMVSIGCLSLLILAYIWAIG